MAAPGRANDPSILELPRTWAASDSPGTDSPCARILPKHFVPLRNKTRQDKKTVEFVCRRLGFPNCFPVTVIGKGSGLVLCWKNDVSVDLVSFSHHHIDVILQHPNGIKERNTFVYGEPCTHIRHEFWSLLRRIKHGRAANLPWVMLGDFNETL